MKIRTGFVSNSSSCSFIIKNTSDKTKTLRDFILENKDLVDQFNEEYDDNETLEDMLESLEKGRENLEFEPHKNTYCVFGDEDHDTVGRVYDYILRDGGESTNFIWWFDEFLR